MSQVLTLSYDAALIINVPFWIGGLGSRLGEEIKD